MTTMHVELDQIGLRRWRLIVTRDGWVIDDRELRGGRRKAKRAVHQVFDNNEQPLVRRMGREANRDMPNSGDNAF